MTGVLGMVVNRLEAEAGKTNKMVNSGFNSFLVGKGWNGI